MGKLQPMNAALLLATLDERKDQIEQLEREAERLRTIIAEQANENTADLDARDKAVAALKEEAKDYRGYWESKVDECLTLKAIIATLDAGAIAQVRKEHTYLIADKDGEIRQLREDLHRCLGWVAAKNEQHPIPGRPEPSPKTFHRVAVGRDQDGRVTEDVLRAINEASR